MPNIGTSSRLAFIATMDIGNFLKNSDKLDNRFGRLGQSLTRLGQTLSRSLSLITGLLEGFAVSIASSFDEIASQLQAITGGQGFDVLIKDARKLGRSTKFTATEVLTLSRELAKLGLTTEETREAVRSTIGITTVFGGNLVQTGDALAALTRQFTDLDLARAADVLSVAFRKTALGTDNFREAFKNVGAVANLTGLSFEKTVAVLGGLANAAQRGGISGNRFKSVLAKLAENGIDAEKGLLAVQKGGNEFAGLLEIFKQRGVIAAGTIGELGLEIEELNLLLEDAGGGAEAFSSLMKDKLFFSVARARAAIEDIGISIGYTLAPFIAKLSDGLEAAADKFAGMDAKAAASQAGFALFLVVLGPIIFVLGQLTIALTALLTPVGLVVSALALFAANAVRAQTTTLLIEGSINKTKKAFQEFRDLVEEVGGSLEGLSTAQLEGQLASLRGQLDGTGERTQEMRDLLSFGEDIGYLSRRLAQIQSRAVTREDENLFELFQRNLTAGISSLAGVDAQDLAELDQALTDARERESAILGDIVDIQAELAKREEERKRIAEERLRLAQSLGLISAEDLDANKDLFSKVIDKLKGSVSEFGVEVSNIKSVFDDLNALDLATFEDAVLGKFPELLAGDLDTAGLQQQADQLEAFAGIFAFAAEGFTELKSKDVAALFLRLKEEAEKLAEAVGRRLLVKELREASDSAIELSESLKTLGLTTQSDVLNAKVKALRQELEGLLELDDPSDSTKTRIAQLVEDIAKAEDALETAQLERKLRSLFKVAEDGIQDIQNPFKPFETAPEVTKKITSLQSRIRDLKETLNAAKVQGVDPFILSIGSGVLTDAVDDLEELFKEEQVALFNDGLAQANAELKTLTSLGDLGVISEFEVAKEKVEILQKAVKEAQVAFANGIIPRTELDNLVDRLKEAQKELSKFYFAALLVRGIADFANLIGDAFREAKEQGKRFGEVLRESLTRVLRELIAKLVVLTALFLILNLLAGGSGKVAQIARVATSEGFGSFIANGLTQGSPSFRSASGGVGRTGVGGQAPVRVEGLLSGNNIVIANQRGARAIDRTFG